MPIVADAAVAIRGDMSKFSGDLNKAKTQTKGLGGMLDKALSPKALVGGLAGGLAATAVIDFLGNAVSAASDFGETMSKVNAIFGEESMPALEKWADTAAETLGVGKQSALDAAATFATFGKSAGLAGDDLVGFSTDLTGLAADLGSFYNTSPEAAITAIGAALRGESEPIRQYGVLLDDATLRQRAMTMGITDSIKNALTPQQKVLAAQAEIFAQTSDAQGDFARTSGGLAGQQKILAAKLADINIEIGEKLLPVMVALTTWVVDSLIPAFEAILPVAIKVIEVAFWPMVKTIEAIIAVISAAVDIATNFALDFGDMGTEVHRIADELGEDFQTVKEIIRRNMLDAGMSFEEAAAAAERQLSGIPSEALIQARRTTEAIRQGLVEGAPEVAEGAEEGLAEPVEEVTDAQAEKATQAARAVTGAWAGELIAGADDVSNAMRVITEGLENEQTKAVRIAEAKAFLTSTALRDALNSEDPYLRLQAIEQREIVEGELEKLTANAQYQAFLTGKTIPTAIRDSQAAAGAAAQGLRLRVAKELEYDSYPGGYSIGSKWIDGIVAGIATKAWLVTEKVNDIAAVTGTSLPTKGPLQHPDKGGRSIGEAWGAGLDDAILRVRKDLGGKLKGMLDPDFAKIPKVRDGTPRLIPPGSNRCAGCDQGCKPFDCARLGDALDKTGDAVSKSNKISDRIRDAIKERDTGKGKAIDKDFFKEISNGFYNSMIYMTAEMAKQLPPLLLKQFAEHNVTVNVVDAGVARSVGDIGRGLRELGETGMLP